MGKSRRKCEMQLRVVPLLLALAVAKGANNVPAWSPNYKMSESTVVMPCNYSGLYNFDAYPAMAKFGLVDYDWSNAKATWVDQTPMDDDGMLVAQAARNKAINPLARVFVYRNIVKALPWYTQVRKLLQDQSYWGWFIPYEGCHDHTTGAYICTNNATGAIDASSNLYHDEEQTPGWTGGGDGGPDGVCHGDTKGDTGKGCDCGDGVSCGEYLWDHRNSSLTAWFTDYYIGGAEYGLGNSNIDGFYLDDSWNGHPSEEVFPCSPRGTGAGRCAGLDKNQTVRMTAGWAKNMNAVQSAIVKHGGFDWQNFKSIRTPAKGDACSSFMREQCRPDSEVQLNAMQYGLGYKYNADYSAGNLTQLEMDLGVFLASRGPYAWLGYGWMGCGCGWEHNGKMPCDFYEFPNAFEVDYGEPVGLCHETSDGSGVFTRKWSKSVVTVDCNAYTSRIVPS